MYFTLFTLSCTFDLVGRMDTWGMQPLVYCILLHYHNIGSYANNLFNKKTSIRMYTSEIKA